MNRRFNMFRLAAGGFAIDAASDKADVDATSSGLSFLKSVGAIPGTWERERLWGEAIAAGPDPVGLQIESWDKAALPFAVNSLRVYKDAIPAGEDWDDSNLLQIVYPNETSVLDIMDLRQQLNRYLADPVGEFGNWKGRPTQEAPWLR